VVIAVRRLGSARATARVGDAALISKEAEMCNSLKSLLAALPVPLLLLLAPTAATAIETADRGATVQDAAPASPAAGSAVAAPWDARPTMNVRPSLRRIGDAGVSSPARLPVRPAKGASAKEADPFRGLIGNFDDACGPFA
jgi:hypothetical protein